MHWRTSALCLMCRTWQGELKVHRLIKHDGSFSFRYLSLGERAQPEGAQGAYSSPKADKKQQRLKVPASATLSSAYLTRKVLGSSCLLLFNMRYLLLGYNTYPHFPTTSVPSWEALWHKCSHIFPNTIVYSGHSKNSMRGLKRWLSS